MSATAPVHRRARFVGFAAAVALVLAALTNTASANDPGTPVAGGLTSGDSLFPNTGNTGYDVSHYEIDLTYNLDGSIEAVTTIDATTTGNPLLSFGLDLEGLTVDGITVDGAAATWTRDIVESDDPQVAKDKLIVTPATPVDGTFTTAVTYSGTPTNHTDPDGSSEGWNATPDGAVAVNEPVGSMTFYPNNNHPTDKATHDIKLTIPSVLPGIPGPTAASNGVLEEKIANPDGSTTWFWKQTKPQATYLTLIAIGQYSEFTSQVTLSDGSTIDELSFVDPLALASSMQGTQRPRIQPITQFFESVYGSYPGISTGLVVDVSTLGYALETQDRPYFEATIGADTLVHEIAHFWFGNSVSPKDWNDLWLNEGPAEFLVIQYNHFDDPAEPNTEDDSYGIWNSTAETDTDWDTPPAAQPDATDLFGWHVYTRGKMAMEALRSAVGTEDFTEIMFEWQDRNKNANGSTADFIALSEEISGLDLEAFWQDWVYDGDKPAWPATYTLGATASPATASTVERGDRITYTLSSTADGKVALAEGKGVATIDLSGISGSATVDEATLPGALALDGDTLTWSIPATALEQTSTATFDVVVDDPPSVFDLDVTMDRASIGGVCGATCTVSHAVAEKPIDPSPQPVITGTPKLGETLTATTPGWAAGTTFTYQWLRDGVAIDGATGETYDVVVEDLDAVLSVRVTGTLTDFDPTTRTSEPTAAVTADEISPSPDPVITGEERVGRTLTANTVGWPEDTTFYYQWLRDGEEIAGKRARRQTYDLVAEDRGAQISVNVGGIRENNLPTNRASEAVGPIAKGIQARNPKPKVKGNAKVGKKLRAKTGRYDAGAKLSYRWFANGKRLAGETSRKLTLRGKHRGKRIAVKVIAKKPGYKNVRKWSKTTKRVRR